MSNPKSYELLRHYQDGHSDAATAIFDRYVARLIALARSRMSAKIRRRIDPEDIVQSAYRSFFVHAKNEEYMLAEAGDLWRLLASITLNKLYGQIEKHTAAMRSIQREDPTNANLDGFQTPTPTEAEMVAIVEQLHLVIADLPTDACLVLTSRLQGQSIEQISESIKKSHRTVRRLLAQAKLEIEKRLLTDNVSATADVICAHPTFAEPIAPLRYSDFVLEKLLGAGGMGKVYRATEKSTGRPVAIKALHKARQSDVRAVALLLQEAQILAKLRHPNIVAVQGLGRFPGGGYFIVMDLIDGIDLQQQLRNGPLSIGKAVDIVATVADAVGHAHDHGIIHCDLKPANVLIDRDNQPIATDFGFAMIVATTQADGGSVIGGTPGYMAPEVFKLRQVPTPAADIYGLGALLWALTTGTAPAGVEHAFNPEGIPASVLAICQKCLAENPRHRFQDAGQLAIELKKTSRILHRCK